MSLRGQLLGFCLMSLVCLLFFHLSQRQLSQPWVQLALNPQFQQVLVDAMHDQKSLALLDPKNESAYRSRFEKTQTQLAHLEILKANRARVTGRYNLVLLSLVGSSLLLIGAMTLWRRRRLEQRLEVLGRNLERLASGETDLAVADNGRDVIGRIGTMIQSTSRVMARTVQRLKSMENLQAWQESSRRMAHEIRTPLTTLRLEVDKLLRTCHKGETNAQVLAEHEQGIREELGQLAAFTDQYTSFAKIGKPMPKPALLAPFLSEFHELYKGAWEQLELVNEVAEDDATQVNMDRRLVRQVMVNLCNNSANALGDNPGRLNFSLHREGRKVVLSLSDNGPGVPEVIREQIFLPYTTTKQVGEGTGLGLAISKKIMLDHQGDLELGTQSGPGAVFHLSFPDPKGAETSPATAKGA